MGVVYKAHDTLLERVVALKIISTSIEDNPDLRERFFREARAAGQLSHRNIITIHDLGEHEGQPFLSMEYLTGEDLQHRLARQEPMSLRRKLEIAADICDGLAYAHRRGLVHRDVKPANIFITDDGVVKLLDFGLARMVTSELTRSNMMMGTLNYMAPEQVRGERTDHRADIFSFGVVLYEMLSGRKAFQGDSFATTLYKILQDVPEPLHNIDSTLPAELEWLVEKSLAKPRDERYQEITDLSRDLAVIRQQLSGSDTVTTASTAFPPQRLPSDPPRSPGSSGSRRLLETPAPLSPPPSAAPERPPTGAQPIAHRWGTAGAALVLLAVGAVGAWLALREPSTPKRATQEPSPPPVSQPAATPQPQPQPQPVPAPPVQEAPAPTDSAPTPQASRRTADDARFRMSRAKTAARQAGSAATGSPAYAAALAAEREGQRLYQAGNLAEATSKFYEANGLFRSAELTPAPAAPAAQHAPPQQRPETQPPPSTAPVPSAPPTQQRPATQPPPSTAPAPSAPPTQPTPTVPASENPVELPPTPAPRVPPVTPPPRAAQPPITAAEGPASPKAEEAIRELLTRYEQALESRNVDALKRIWPTLQGSQEEAVRKDFLHARRIQVDIDDTNITVTGNSATVTFTRGYHLATVDGQRLDSASRTTMSVRRAGNEWVIDRLRFEAPK